MYGYDEWGPAPSAYCSPSRAPVTAGLNRAESDWEIELEANRALADLPKVRGPHMPEAILPPTLDEILV